MNRQKEAGFLSGKMLAAYRRRCGYTQRQLADLLQMPLAEVARLEREYVVAVSLNQLETIADVLQVPAWLLLPQEEDSPQLKP